MDETRNKLQQLQQAIEVDNVTVELKDYISRLQEKLARVRSLGGNYGKVDLSPYLKAVQDQELSAAVIVENKQRAGSGKTARTI